MKRHAVQNFIYQHFPISCVIYAKRHYPYSWRTLLGDWKAASGEVGTRCSIVGDEITQADAFFARLAERRFDESVQYACIYGCCTVIWHPTQGNTGGMGRPGCPCENMDDPRDLQRGPILSRGD